LAFQDVLQRLQASQQYAAHIKQVVLDRTLEEQLLVDQQSGRPILVIHWDAMDQSKWSVPRHKNCNSKTFQTYDRPRLRVMGVWLHFFDLRLFILDPRLHAGGSAVVECASRAIEDLVLQCQQKGVEVPSELCVWSDNTVKENKNQTVLSWMQWLVSRQKFKSCSLSCAITGHTHNALDQVYGLLATAFRYVTDLSDPHDVVQQISTLTGRLNLSAWLGADCRVTATYVKSIWNWRDWHLDTIRIIHPISHISNIQCFFLVLTLQPPCIFL